MVVGSTGDDKLVGTANADTIYDFAGDGIDRLFGGAGDDSARASAGVQSLYGGSSKDYISYYDSPEGITINLDANTITGSWASDDLIDAFESVGGSKTGDDTMYSTSGDNTFKGYGGDDRFMVDQAVTKFTRDRGMITCASAAETRVFTADQDLITSAITAAATASPLIWNQTAIRIMGGQ